MLQHICSLEAFDKEVYPDYDECVSSADFKVALISEADMKPEFATENTEEVRQKIAEIDAEIADLGQHVLAEVSRREEYKVPNI
jgi:hypothetical protein